MIKSRRDRQDVDRLRMPRARDQRAQDRRTTRRMFDAWQVERQE